MPKPGHNTEWLIRVFLKGVPQHAFPKARQTPVSQIQGVSPMSDTTQMAAPQYHVQTTAAELRDGFPYFCYHESVSKLWAEKWRPLCTRGIYPFTDGNVLDFDLIFAELVRISEDRSDFLYKPDEYAKPFFPVAENLVVLAEQAEAQGDTAKAKDFYLRAAAVYRISRFPINRSEVSQFAWLKGKETYVKAVKYLDPSSVALAVPFNYADSSAGDDEVPIQAYLRMPKGAYLRRAGLYFCWHGGFHLPYRRQFYRCHKGKEQRLIVRGNRQHLGNRGAEDILYDWIDHAISGTRDPDAMNRAK